MTTLVVTPRELAAPEVEVTGRAYRHLFRARRLTVGERVRLVDGHGRAVWGAVARVDRRLGIVEIGGSAPSNEPPVLLELLVAAPRPERAAWLVEKATELGVSVVRWFNAERAPRSYGPGTLKRLQRVAAAAVEQCDRSLVPEVTGMHDWEEVTALLKPASASYFLHRGGQRQKPQTAPHALLLVGPEGGWTHAEREELAGRGCRGVGLGPRVLRVETAAVVGAALLLQGCDPSPATSPEGV